MRSITRAMIFATGVALSISMAIPAPAAASTAPVRSAEDTTGAVSWGVAPADVDGDVRTSFRVAADPGARVEDELTVFNRSAQDVTFDLLASDGFIGDDGAFDVLQSGVASIDVGTWIEIQATVDVPAHSEVAIPFAIEIPQNAAPGDHPGGIVASVSQSGGGQVGLNTRVGARVHLRVSGDFTPTLLVSDLRVDPEISWNPFAPGDTTLTYTIRNDGNLRLGSVQIIGMNGLFGLPTGAVAERPEQRELLPGAEIEVSTRVHSTWPLGWMFADVTAEPILVGGDEIDVALEPGSAQAGALAIPISQLILLVLVGGAVWLIIWRRRGSKERFERAVAERVAATDRADAA